jgi:hypothetical protein
VRVLVSPVSTQVFPVVVTALTLKPKTVVLLSTDKMKKFTSMIENVLTYCGISVEKRLINPYSRDSILRNIEDLKESTFLLNCGTKFTAINLYRASDGKAIYYLPSGKIVDFSGNVVAEVPGNLVDVELHAKMYGFEIVEEREDIRRIKLRKELTEFIASNSDTSLLLSKLFRAKSFSKLPSGKLGTLLLKHEIVRKHGREFLVLDRDYVGGKWLEEYTFLKLFDLGFFDVHIGVKVNWYGSNILNEIDVMAVNKNRLYIFSCKTGRNIREIVKHLYELEELTERIGGDFGRSYLVVSRNVLQKSPPDRKKFPHMPSIPYKNGRNLWKKYYQTPEGKRYRNAISSFKSTQNLLKRAALLNIRVLTPEELEAKIETESVG